MLKGCYNMTEIKLITNNKKAYHNYFISDILEAGISLSGSEVKSIRSGHMSIDESFIQIINGEIFLKNAYIKTYEQSKSFLLDERRNRKLLLHSAEISKLERKVVEKGFTIVPLKVYFKNHLVKIEIGLGKGKKLYDKKQDLIEKSKQREIDIALKMKR